MACRTVLLGSLAALTFAFAAESAYANSVDIYTTVDRVGTGGGGAFKITGFDDPILPVSSKITSVDSNGADSFNTFCIEKNEHISLPGYGYSYTIDTKAVYGGVGGGSPDPLGAATAKLYYAYWSGQLDGFSVTSPASTFTFKYTSGGNHGADMDALQEAIWRLENESTSTGGKAGDLVDFANSVSWSDLNVGHWSGIGHVRVVNLKSGSTHLQSQLVVVPLPAGALMGFALLGALGIAKRIRSRRQHAIV